MTLTLDTVPLILVLGMKIVILGVTESTKFSPSFYVPSTMLKTCSKLTEIEKIQLT